jgi:MYXO-CTERM domain-containing protein
MSLALPAQVRAADAPAPRVVVRADRARAISDLLVAADGKLVQIGSIPALKATIFAGRGEWSGLSTATLADSIRELARARSISLVYIEGNEVARAEGGDCCTELKLPKTDAEVAHLAKRLRWAHKSLRLEGETASAKGTLVAVLDTGVDEGHALLSHALVEGESLEDSDPSVRDRNGHGTAMAGVIVAEGPLEHDPRGIAPGARVLPIKVLDDRGTGDVATLAQGIVRAVERGARVILVSAGVAAPSRLLDDAVKFARSHDAIVVAAAGNEPVGRALYPAGTKGALAITSSRDEGKLSLACALDPVAELAAPGDLVHTTLPRSILGGQAVLSGTSFSAAFVAGVAALGFSRGHSADEVLRALRGARREIPALAGKERFLPIGELDAKLALDRLEMADRSLDAVWTLPEVARPKGSLKIRARVRASGGRAVAPGSLSVLLGDSVLSTVALPELPKDGLAVEVEAPVTLPAHLDGSSLALTVRLSPDDDATDDERKLVLPVVASDAPPSAKLTIAAMAVEDDRDTLAVTVENAGERTEDSITVGATADGSPLPAIAPVVKLDAGAQAVARFALPTRVTETPVKFVAGVKGRAGSVTGRLDVRFAGKDPRPVRPQYEQSNDVDVIADAPWRLEPTRPYVPVMVFIPSKGDSGFGVDITIDSAKVVALDDPTGASGTSTTLYDYQSGVSVASDPSRFAAGTTIIDENGQDIGSLNLFQDATLTDNGRHEVIRFPRAAFGVAAQPQASVQKYVDVLLHYTAHRNVSSGSVAVDTGDVHKVMRVTFDAKALPALPGTGHYYDTHCHTIAEWYLSSSPLDIFAPRKAYGGPIVMIREAAYAIGLTDSAQPGPGEIITTDHSCFHNSEDPDANDGLRRVQVGPSAPQNSKDASGNIEDLHTRYQELFGPTANEEVSFDQPQSLTLGPIGVSIPQGAHMLAFRAGHWEERWNATDGGASPNQRRFGSGALELSEILDSAAKKDPSGFRDAFFYSAHAWGGIPWAQDRFELALELTPSPNGTRPGAFQNDVTQNFVFKGHQLWNGRCAHNLPSSNINWNDMNPWTDPSFQKGASAWGRTLEGALLDYQAQVAQLLRCTLASAPGQQFPRKLYVAAGSDAHGDFNMEEGRMATFVPLASTYYTNDSAFGKARTYVFEDGVSGATDGTRAMNALAQGRTTVTDGPLARFAFDANARFDGTKLVYHAATATFEDQDGTIGGGGNGPDGAGTALVVAGSPDAAFSYRYEDAPDASVQALEVFKVEAGTNPTTRKVHDADSNSDYNAPGPACTLPASGADQDLTASAGAYQNLCVVQLAAYAGGDPAQGALGPEVRRCYTNPIWIAPVQVEWVSRQYDATAGKFPAGGIRIRFHFPLSMSPSPYQAEIKGLDGQGNSTDGTVAGNALVPASGTGWSTDPNTGVLNSLYEVVNQGDISLAQADYPTPGTATFALYFRDAPQDSFGNALNRIAFTFDAPRIGTPSSTAPASTAAVGSTTPASTSTSGFVNFGHAGGGGGCVIATESSTDARALLPLVAVALILLVRRRRSR